LTAANSGYSHSIKYTVASHQLSSGRLNGPPYHLKGMNFRQMVQVDMAAMNVSALRWSALLMATDDGR
jgi:hypothetical protein